MEHRLDLPRHYVWAGLIIFVTLWATSLALIGAGGVAVYHMIMGVCK